MRDIKTADMQHIEGAIFDFDGVFWPAGFAPKDVRYKIFSDACGWAIKDLSGTSEALEVIEEENISLYLLHWEKSQDMLCEKYGVDRIAFQRLYNKLARENFSAQEKVYGMPCLRDEFSQLAQSTMRYGILSHAHRDEYIVPFLDDNGLSEHINKWNIIGTRELHGKSKADGPEPYIMMQSVLGTAFQKTVMVEDSPHNLIWAKRMGMTTIWLHDGEPSTLREGCAPYIDFHTDKFENVLRQINECNKPQEFKTDIVVPLANKL